MSFRFESMALVVCLVTILIAACSGPQNGLFSSKIPHQKYADQLNNAGLHKTALGQQWLRAANKGLAQPLTIQLPYKETGYFDAASPDAAGYRINVRRGDKLVVELNQKPVAGYKLFLDLWQPNDKEQPKLLTAPDSALSGFTYEIKKDGAYIIRLQPELLAGIEYTLTIRTAPSLAFPVATSANPTIGSFWGAARDAGARKHEGIDIFGKKHTPLVAAADGVITSVSENKLGGKVVFMRPDDKDFVLYYAHLDSQLVQQGQRVKTGDVLGLMGNTGNARTTLPHLHFGIYSNGAIDPLPFVNRSRPEPPAIDAPIVHLNKYVRSTKKTSLLRDANKLTVDAATLLRVKAATGNWYKVILPDETEGLIAATDISQATTALRQYTVNNQSALYDKPDTLAAIKSIIPTNTKLPVLGVFRNYYYVKNGSTTGWVNSLD